MICINCLERHVAWNLDPVAAFVACPNCGLRISYHILAHFGNPEQYLNEDRYRIRRLGGDPPTVEVTDLKAASARWN